MWSNTDVSNPSIRGWVDPTSSDLDTHIFRWLWLYKYDTLIETLVSNWYLNHPADQFEEPIADLACWQAGLLVDNCNEQYTGIPGIAAQPGGLFIYPNPANGFVDLDICNKNSEETTLNIYNIMGELIRSMPIHQNHCRINTGDLSNGIYIIEIRLKERVVQQKLVIQR